MPRSRAISAACIMPRVPRSLNPPGTSTRVGAVEQPLAARLLERLGLHSGCYPQPVLEAPW
jgi:hypothetical protein